MTSVPLLRDRTLLPEAVGYAILTILGAALVATSFGYGLRTDDDWIGPGFLPLVVGGLLLLLSGTELVRSLLGKGAEHHDRLRDLAPDAATDDEVTDDPDGTDIFGRTAKQRVQQLWTVVAAMAVTILLVPLLGLPVAFGGLVLFISTWVERRPFVTAAIITAVSVTVIYVVFVILLSVPLPAGLLGLGA